MKTKTVHCAAVALTHFEIQTVLNIEFFLEAKDGQVASAATTFEKAVWYGNAIGGDVVVLYKRRDTRSSE